MNKYNLNNLQNQMCLILVIIIILNVQYSLSIVCFMKYNIVYFS